jgi:hypothetical protein
MVYVLTLGVYILMVNGTIYGIHGSYGIYSIYNSIYSITRALAATAQLLFDPTSLLLIRNMEVNPIGFSRSNNFCS